MLNGFLKSLGMGKSRRNQVAEQSRAFFEPMESRRLLALFYAPELADINAPLLNYTLPPNNSAKIYYVAPQVTSNKISTNVNDPGNLVYTLNNAPNNSTVILRGGDYRFTTMYSLTKPLTLQAYPNEQPILKGSNTPTSWTQTTDANGNPVWYTPWSFKMVHGNIADLQDPTRPEAAYLDMVFRNGVSVRQVLDNPMTAANEGYATRPFEQGTFWIGTVSGQQRVYVADNPVGQLMEITGQQDVFQFAAGSAGSVIKGITFAHGARNGVTVSSGGITFENNLFAWNGNFGFGAQSGNTIIRGNAFVSNGHNGISGDLNNSNNPGIFENNYVAWNNNEGFKYSWNASGVKFTKADNLRVYNNLVENNYAMGIWLDVHANNGQMIGNVVLNNLGFGLFYESSYGGIIAFNVSVNNTWGGIQIADAGGIQVWNNTVVGANEGIIVKDGYRFNAPGKTPVNYDQNELLKGSWEISYANVIKNNIISSSKNRQLKANEVYDPVQDPDPLNANHPEGATIGNIFNPLPLQHQGSKTMFYTTSGTTGTWTPVANAINYNAFHNTPTGTGKGAVLWKTANAGSQPTWTPAQFKTNTDQNDVFLDLSSTDPLFIDAGNGDYRLLSTSAAVAAGTSIPTAIRNAAAAAGISSGLYNTTTPHLGALDVFTAPITLPEGWSAADIGSPSIAGSTTYNSGLWTVNASGADIWSTSDQFHFARRTFNANTTTSYTVIARVDTQSNTHPWAKAGVMIRGSLAADSRYAGVFLTPSNGITFQWRDNASAITQNMVVSGISGPVWVKVAKQGNTFAGYYSSDGQQWIQIGTANFGISSTSYAGLAVTSHTNSALSTATFSNVSAGAGADVTRPQLTGGSFDQTALPHTIQFTFDEDVSGSLSLANLRVVKLGTNVTLPSSDFDLDFDPEEGLASYTYLPNGGRLADGSYEITFLNNGVTDAAGNPLTGSVSFQRFIDLTPPTANFQSFNNQGTPHQLGYVFSEDVSASLSTLDLQVIRVSNGAVMTGWNLAYNTASNTATFTYTGSGTGLLPDGNYNITLLAAGVTDTFGNAMTANVNSTISVDRTAPTVSVSLFNQSLLPHRFVFNFSENVSASLGLNDLQVINTTTGQTLPSTGFSLAYNSSLNRATYTYTANAGVLPDGLYQVTLLRTGVSDVAGNMLASDGVLSFTVDQTPPIALFQTFNNQGTPHQLVYAFSEDVSASLGTNDLQVIRVSNGAVMTGWNLAYNSSSNVGTFTYTGSGNGLLPDGSYNITLLAAGVTDAFGNPMAANVTSTIHVDRTAPTVSVGAFNQSTQPHRFVFNFSENVSASLGLNDLQVVHTTTSTTLPTNHFSLAYDAALNRATYTYTANGGKLTDGEYQVTLLRTGVSDAAGNMLASNGLLSFTMDLTPPTASAVGSFAQGILPHQFVYSFSENVGASLDSTDLQITNLGNSQVLPPSAIQVGWNAATLTATFSAVDGTLPAGNYEVRLLTAGITDSFGNNLAQPVVQTINVLGLPTGWASQDIDTVGASGTSWFDGTTWTVIGSGTDINGTLDAFHYASRSARGDLRAIVRLDTQQNTSSSAKSGLMIRAGLDANAPHAFVAARPDGKIIFRYRTTTGGGTTGTVQATANTPVFLRLDRIGNAVSAFWSSDGVSWSQIGSAVTLSNLPDQVQVGMAVTSNNNGVRNTSTFSQFSLDDAALPTGWTGGDFNAPAMAGTSTEFNGTYTLTAAGAGMGGTTDQYHWAYQTFNADSTPLIHATARVDSVSSGEAGVMIRGNLNAGSRVAAVLVNASGDVRFLWRTDQGVASQSTSIGTLTGPVWVRVMRQGNNFSGFVSTDGNNWTQIGSPRTISIASLSYIGLVGSSRNVAATATSTFTQVNIGISAVQQGVTLEARNTTSLTGPMSLYSDATAMGGSYLMAPLGTNSTSTAPSTGIASYQVQLDTAGTYNLWLRTIATSASDSFWVRVNGGSWVKWNGIATSSTWQWNRVYNSDAGNATLSLNLSAGINTIDIAYREGGTKFDALYLGLAGFNPA